MAMTYAEKLKDPRWLVRRQQILERDEFKCRSCGVHVEGDEDHDRHILNVHHKVYYPGRQPWDYPDEVLITYCRDCHQDAEDLIKEIVLLIYRGCDGDIRRMTTEVRPWLDILRDDGTASEFALSCWLSNQMSESQAEIFIRCLRRLVRSTLPGGKAHRICDLVEAKAAVLIDKHYASWPMTEGGDL